MNESKCFTPDMAPDCTGPKFTLEGDTLYWGRCRCMHGYNLGQLTDRSYNAMDILNNRGKEKTISFEERE